MEGATHSCRFRSILGGWMAGGLGVTSRSKTAYRDFHFSTTAQLADFRSFLPVLPHSQPRACHRDHGTGVSFHDYLQFSVLSVSFSDHSYCGPTTKPGKARPGPRLSFTRPSRDCVPSSGVHRHSLDAFMLSMNIPWHPRQSTTESQRRRRRSPEWALYATAHS